jgi:tetraacyldisaccharide 4'-kinase
MRRSPPGSWSETPPATLGARSLGCVLRAAEPLFRSGLICRDLLYRQGLLVPTRAGIPVISVGGIEVGGVGKTPLVLELARLALRAGLRPAILSRGYGGGLVPARGALRVPFPLPEGAAQDFGDEPACLAEALGHLGGLGV